MVVINRTIASEPAFHLDEHRQIIQIAHEIYAKMD